MKSVLYAVAVACFVLASAFDFRDGEYKLACVALMFGITNGLIFFWR